MTDSIDLIGYIDSTGIPYKIRSSNKGNQIALQYCPYCEQGQKGDFSHFYFSQDTQTFYCQKCGIKGNLYRFKLDRGDVSPVTKSREIKYERPKENKSLTSEVDKFYSWYQKERGINSEILEKYKVGFTKRDGKNVIAYQYYDQKGVLFNRKYRTEDKKFWTEKDAESNFYGLQFIDLKKKYLIVCEGEDDLHALVQYGFENVLSVPYGAGNYSPAMDRIIKQVDEIFLCFDNDPTGQEGARKFAEKAGLPKCKNVILPFKDARECLLQQVHKDQIEFDIASAQQFRHEEIVKANDLKDDFMKFIRDEGRLSGRAIRMPEFNKIVGGIRTSELTILTGYTGRGKTTFAYNFVRWAEEIGSK